MVDENRRTNDLYDMEAVLDRVRHAARLYLSDPWTVETIRWEDGDFRVEAFHTIDETYPIEEEVETPGGLDGDDARPFYRERVVFSTAGDEAGYVFLEVVRKRTGRTAAESVYRTPVEWVGIRDARTRFIARDLWKDLRLDAGLPATPPVHPEGPESRRHSFVPAGEISVDVDVDEEELQEFRDRFEEGA